MLNDKRLSPALKKEINIFISILAVILLLDLGFLVLVFQNKLLDYWGIILLVFFVIAGAIFLWLWRLFKKIDEERKNTN